MFGFQGTVFTVLEFKIKGSMTHLRTFMQLTNRLTKKTTKDIPIRYHFVEFMPLKLLFEFNDSVLLRNQC